MHHCHLYLAKPSRVNSIASSFLLGPNALIFSFSSGALYMHSMRMGEYYHYVFMRYKELDKHDARMTNAGCMPLWKGSF